MEQRLPLFEVGVIRQHLLTSVRHNDDFERQTGVQPYPISAECDACDLDTVNLQHLHAPRLGATLINGLGPHSSNALVYLDRYRRSLDRSLTEALAHRQHYQQERAMSEE